MNGMTVAWIGGALASLGLAGGVLLLGISLLPERTAVIDAGTLVPWYIAWVMVLGTASIALVLAGYILKTAKGGHD